MNAPTNTLTASENTADEILNDRALVAFIDGWARRADGNGVGFAPAWDRLATLVRRGLLQTEARSHGATPLVWPTSAGHDVLADICAEGTYPAHVDAIKAAL